MSGRIERTKEGKQGGGTAEEERMERREEEGKWRNGRRGE